MFGRGKKKVSVGAVFAGTAVDVSEVPDPVFAQRMLGEGFAVIPPTEVSAIEIGSPVKGTITKVFKTGHAFVARSEEVRGAGLDPITPVVFSTKDQVGKVDLSPGETAAGQVIATVTLT